MNGAGWQPIATAPRDGTSFLSFDGEFHGIDLWDRGNRIFICDASRRFSYPTDWMPLPAPPVTT